MLGCIGQARWTHGRYGHSESANVAQGAPHKVPYGRPVCVIEYTRPTVCAASLFSVFNYVWEENIVKEAKIYGVKSRQE